MTIVDRWSLTILRKEFVYTANGENTSLPCEANKYMYTTCR